MSVNSPYQVVWLNTPWEWCEHALTVICDFHLANGTRVHITEQNLGELKLIDNALCCSVLDLLKFQSRFEVDKDGYGFVTCPWVHEHVTDEYPSARINVHDRRFTCIHPSCVKRTFDEALSQLAHSAAEAVLSANSEEKTPCPQK